MGAPRFVFHDIDENTKTILFDKFLDFFAIVILVMWWNVHKYGFNN
jgi:hypothetical protein